jgi:hypothetical protein
MATVNVSAATSTLSSSAFLQSAVLVVVGSLLAQVVVSYARSNVYDIGMTGGDAVYAVVAALIPLMVLPGEYGRPVALGSTATAVRTAASEFGVV